MRIYLIAIALILGMTSCAPSSQSESSTTQSTKEALPDTFRLDLTQIALPPTGSREIEVKAEEVFESPAHYQAIDFDSLIRATWPIDQLTTSDYRLFFRTNDNYNVSMSLDEILAGGGYLAWNDLAAPEGSRWQALDIGGTLKDLNPFYLVWTNAPDPNRALVWPYGLEKIFLAKESVN